MEETAHHHCHLEQHGGETVTAGQDWGGGCLMGLGNPEKTGDSNFNHHWSSSQNLSGPQFLICKMGVYC